MRINKKIIVNIREAASASRQQTINFFILCYKDTANLRSGKLLHILQYPIVHACKLYMHIRPTPDFLTGKGLLTM